jgi:hypothetical protein
MVYLGGQKKDRPGGRSKVVGHHPLKLSSRDYIPCSIAQSIRRSGIEGECLANDLQVQGFRFGRRTETQILTQEFGAALILTDGSGTVA